MDEIKQKSGNIGDILNIINRAKESFCYEVYIPSLNRNVMFRELNTSQQKRLLKAIIDSPAYNTEFIFALRQIIIENCAEEIDVNALTVYDKLMIALTMRSMSVGNHITLEFTSSKGTKKKPPKKMVREINLNDLIEKAKSDIKITDGVIKDDGGKFEVSCSLPSISDEYNLEIELHKDITSIEIEDEKQLRQIVGEVYINELVKYIKKMVIAKDDGSSVELDMTTMNFKNRIKLVESLPVKVMNKIVTYINGITKEFNKVLIVKDEIDGEVIEQRLRIDASFFTAS